MEELGPVTVEYSMIMPQWQKAQHAFQEHHAPHVDVIVSPGGVCGGEGSSSSWGVKGLCKGRVGGEGHGGVGGEEYECGCW